MEISKNNCILAELARISVYFNALDEKQKAVISPLIQNAAFLRVTLDELQETINSDGLVDEYQNGRNQSGMKQSASLQAYNNTMKVYLMTIKTLFGFLPPKARQAATFAEKFYNKMTEDGGA